MSLLIENTLPQPNRFITTHDPESGKAIISDALPSAAQWQHLANGNASFFLAYCTSSFPANLSSPPPTSPTTLSDSPRRSVSPTIPSDIQSYTTNLASPPGLVIPTGTVLRYVDMKPGHLSPMHRTVSLDYGVVLEGEVELVLDSGETRTLRRGDTAVQRATAHAWRNTSPTEWARMLFVLVPCEEVEVGGRVLAEDLGGMVGVRASE